MQDRSMLDLHLTLHVVLLGCHELRVILISICALVEVIYGVGHDILILVLAVASTVQESLPIVSVSVEKAANVPSCHLLSACLIVELS